MLFAKKKRILLWLQGGLGNRLRAIEAAIVFSEKTGARLDIIWPETPEMVAPYQELLKTTSFFNLVEEPFSVRLLNYLIRKKQPFMVSIYRKLMPFKVTMLDHEVAAYKDRYGELQPLLSQDSVFLRTNHPVDHFERRFNWVEPVSHLAAKLAEYQWVFKQFERVVGVHVRRTDHGWAIANSSDELFFNYMYRELRDHPNAVFFLFTDNEDTEKLYCSQFGEKIIHRPKKYGRDTVEATQDGLIDWLLLSQCQVIMHSYWSSFSYTASFKNGALLMEMSENNLANLESLWPATE